MYERHSRFLTMPGDIKLSPATARPTMNGARLAKWRVRLEVGGHTTTKEHDVIVLAYSSEDATQRARADFYGRWATQADRERIPLRVLELLQVDV